MIKMVFIMEDYNDKQIVLFDGVCNLCSSVVQFILIKNTKENLLFASLQSDFGQAILQKHNLQSENFTSFIFLDKGNLYLKSDAALNLSIHLKLPWSLLIYFKIFPNALRNLIYDLIAKNRYNWFGKKSECWIPNVNYVKRML